MLTKQAQITAWHIFTEICTNYYIILELILLLFQKYQQSYCKCSQVHKLSFYIYQGRIHKIATIWNTAEWHNVALNYMCVQKYIPEIYICGIL